MCVGVWTVAHMEVRGQLEGVSVLQPCGSRDQNQVIRLSGKHLYLLSPFH